MNSKLTYAPFCGFRYNPEKIHDLTKVVAPPYDVIDARLQEKLYALHPNNVVRLILTKEEPGSGLSRYELAARDLDAWISSQILIQDPGPSIYVYHHTFRLEDGRVLTRKGWIARRRLEEFETGKIRPHEWTFSGPKADRLNLLRATRTNLSCIFGLFSDPNEVVSGCIESFLPNTPIVDLHTDDGECHQLFKITDPELFLMLNQKMDEKTLFIADGHHRYETALNYREECRQKSKNWTGEEAENFVLMYVCAMEDPGLLILPTHRVVKAPAKLSWSAMKEKLEIYFKTIEYSDAEEQEALDHLEALSRVAHAFLLRSDQTLALCWIAPNDLSKIPQLSRFAAEIRDLDVTILHEYLLPEIWGLPPQDPKQPTEIEYVKDAKQALSRVREAAAHAAFILNPTRIEQVEAVSKIGERMPQKSTFFYPKLLSGLVFNRF